MATPVVSNSADFSIFNSGWNGTSDLAIFTYTSGKFSPTFELRSSGAKTTVEQVGLADLSLSPSEDALIVIGPMKGFSSIEGEKVGNFVRGGGLLLLADDFGTGNSLLKAMNATSRFSGNLVMDLAFEKQPEFSVCFDIRADDTTKNVSTLLLNYPSSLTVNASTTQVLARSSIASWLDTSGDRLQEWGEPRGPFPLIARETMGMGAIYLLSDPSVLINGMAKEMDNGVFRSNLIGYLSEGRSSVLFDESHRDFFDPVAVTLQFAGDISPNAKAALILISLVLTLWVSTDMIDRSLGWAYTRAKSALLRLASIILPSRLWRKQPASKEPIALEAVIDELQKRHPDWRPGLLRYIVREKKRHSGALNLERL